MDRAGERGSALVSALVVFLFVFGLMYATVAISTVEVKEARTNLDAVRTRFIAEAGFESGMNFLGQAAGSSTLSPLAGLSGLFAASKTIEPLDSVPLFDGNAQVGAYSVSLTLIDETPTDLTVLVQATGYLPDAPSNLAPGARVDSWESIGVTVQYVLAPSEVFDYAYFINNWGWFYGNTIFANGSVRSNGQFDVAGYSPTVNGQPSYDSVEWNGVTASLYGYSDDNGDGLEDGNDGGIFSSWDIVSAQNVQGSGGAAMNQHDFEEPVPMPNLADLTQYEDLAISEGSSISIAGSVVCDEVLGDEGGERQNLYLFGTLADPIVLDGPVVVRGDVMISGYVTGQGAIYADGNVYVPDSIQYVDGPGTTRPTGTTQAETETWLSDNWDKDFLGLFSNENVVIGDHTDPTWRFYVSGWMSSSLNKSEEDAGEDGIPNTYAGRDGIVGTADDDLLEDDGVFTVELYTDAQAALGLIPAGFNVGDAIPGTGEDIDGDGTFDDTTDLGDIDFSVALDTTNWGGNLPPGGISDYSSVASLYANHLDATFYTNHTFAYLVLGSEAAEINGAIISRNESIIYGTPRIDINHDSRLLGGSSGMAGPLLPKVLQSPTILRWTVLDFDPNNMQVVQ